MTNNELITVIAKVR